jgi:hypothetical protein
VGFLNSALNENSMEAFIGIKAPRFLGIDVALARMPGSELNKN